MTSEEAFEWLKTSLGVSRETFAKLEHYHRRLTQAQEMQNLVSAATMPQFWSRHVIDSAQLIALNPEFRNRTWLDIGSGAGIPGLVIAMITSTPMILVEPRARRAKFLGDVTKALGLKNVEVVQHAIERYPARSVDVITARAVAPLPKLISMAVRFAHSDTVWILPKGKGAQAELASLPDTWQGDWELHKSVTDEDSYILVGRRVRMSSKA